MRSTPLHAEFSSSSGLQADDYIGPQVFAPRNFAVIALVATVADTATPGA